MSVLQAFAERKAAEGVRVCSLGHVLLLRGEPVAMWSGDRLRFTQGVFHTLEARKLLDELGKHLGTGSLAFKGMRVSSAVWFEIQLSGRV